MILYAGTLHQTPAISSTDAQPCPHCEGSGVIWGGEDDLTCLDCDGLGHRVVEL